MNILQLCHRVPFPGNDGGNIAMISLADSLLSQGASLKMFTLNTRKHEVDLEKISEGTRTKYRVETIPIDTTVNPWDAFANLFSKASYNVERFYTGDFENALIRVLRKDSWDIVLLESLFMTPYIPAIRENSKATIVLRAHNVEHIIWERLAQNEKNPLKQQYLRHLARKLKSVEKKILGELDALMPITADDERLFRQMGCRLPTQVTPVGMDMAEYQSQADNDASFSLFHLGSMDWLPNVEGVNWFLEKCWQPVHQKFPSLKLCLAGRGFPQNLMNNPPPNVVCEGEILDAKKFMYGKQGMIVPLKSGGGLRVKIVQGMALGKTIISTTIGAEGIRYSDGKDLLIADTPEQFLDKITACMKDGNYSRDIGKEARKTAVTHYSNEAIGRMVMDFFKSVRKTVLP